MRTRTLILAFTLAVFADPIAPVLMAIHGPRVQQAAARLSESDARAIALEVVAMMKQTGAEEKAFPILFRTLASQRVPGFSDDPVPIQYDDRVSVFLVGPAALYLISASEAVRKMEPVESVAWPSGVSISVRPKQIGAPSYEKVVVTRDGQTVQPLSSDLQPQELQTRAGVTQSIYKGIVVYPMSDFLPGGQVTVTLIPASGDNVRKSFSQDELRKIH